MLCEWGSVFFSSFFHFFSFFSFSFIYLFMSFRMRNVKFHLLVKMATEQFFFYLKFKIQNSRIFFFWWLLIFQNVWFSFTICLQARSINLGTDIEIVIIRIWHSINIDVKKVRKKEKQLKRTCGLFINKLKTKENTFVRISLNIFSVYQMS